VSLLRIATVDFLNARPLIRGFTHAPLSSRVRLLSGTPAQCAHWLRHAETDVALIPSIEYLRIPGLRVLPLMAIAVRRQARSVLLFSRVAAPEIRRVAVDQSSRTSSALLRILLNRRSRHRVDYREMEPSLGRMLAFNDAALLIGDAALKEYATGLKVYDLAAEWYAMTGLPFVFAFWAMRPGAILPDALEPFLESKRLGLAERERIACEASTELGLPAHDLIRYLHENIYYDLGVEEMKALWLFYHLAKEASLVGAAREVAFYEAPAPAADPAPMGGVQ